MQDLDTHISLSQTEKAKELEQMKQWVADTPHIPGAALAKALEAAAWRPADNSSRGFVIVNSGRSPLPAPSTRRLSGAWTAG